MAFAEFKPEWLEMVRTQEATLRPEKFDAEDALRLGNIMIRLAKEIYRQPISIRIISHGQVTFSYLMEGTDNFNEWWMDKKLNTARLTGTSSIRALMEVATGVRAAESEFEDDHNFALCGGCFPLVTPAGKPIGYALSSGMAHERDHQLLADALAELLDADIPRLID